MLRRILARYLEARALPLPPSFPREEIGLMTRDEFLRLRNPTNKHHSEDSYDFGLYDLNRENFNDVGEVDSGGYRLTVYQSSEGYIIRDSKDEGRLVAVIHDGTLYYDRPHLRGHFPTSVYHRFNRSSTDLGIKNFKQVKYLSEVMPLVSPIAKRNEARLPVILQRLIVKGEPLTVRAEEHPQKDKGTTLAILNSDNLVVAQATNEWGATLITVAREYRGKGLGKILGKVWYQHNPNFTSGGFTEAGEENALAMWKDRVREFSSMGWYSALVQDGRLSKEKVKQILTEAGEVERKPRTAPPPETKAQTKPTGEILVYSDGETCFVVYDRAFLEDPDERFIHGYGFFRDAHPIGVFIYAIDYDRPFADLTTRVALQMARDQGETLYNGEGYHDLVELDDLPGVEIEGDYIKVTRDLIPLKSMVQKERRTRKADDPYEEKRDLLIEMGESKWK